MTSRLGGGEPQIKGHSTTKGGAASAICYLLLVLGFSKNDFLFRRRRAGWPGPAWCSLSLAREDVWVLGEEKEGVGLDCGELHPTAHSTRKKYNYKTAHRYTVNVYVH